MVDRVYSIIDKLSLGILILPYVLFIADMLGWHDLADLFPPGMSLLLPGGSIALILQLGKNLFKKRLNGAVSIFSLVNMGFGLIFGGLFYVLFAL